jgi:hypothetical protein
MRSARRCLSWRQLKRRINDKAVYIELWKSKLNTSPIILTPIEAMAKSYDKNFNDKKTAKDIDSIDHAYEDIPRYRSSEVYVKILKQIYAAKNRTDSILQSLTKVIDIPINLLSSSSPAPVPAGPVLTLTSETAALLRAIERHASFDDIMYFRYFCAYIDIHIDDKIDVLKHTESSFMYIFILTIFNLNIFCY